MKIAINNCYGGFGLSNKACEMLSCEPYDYECHKDRANKELIRVIEKLGRSANGSIAFITIEEIPDEATDWLITDKDGLETLYFVLDGKIYTK